MTSTDPAFTAAVNDLSAALDGTIFVGRDEVESLAPGITPSNSIFWDSLAHDAVNASFEMATCGWVLGPLPDRTIFDKVSDALYESTVHAWP